nr:hypothetical protein [Tanacetum cinerariifolium]
MLSRYAKFSWLPKETEQLKLATKRSKTQFHSSHTSGSGVPDVPIYESESKKESWGDSGEEEDNNDDSNDDDGGTDDHDDDSDDERTKSDRDEIPYPNLTHVEQTEQEEEEYKEEYEVTKELYDDVNVNLGNEDIEMTNADQELYDDVNVNLGNEDIEMTNADQENTTSLLALPDFVSVFKFNERVTNLEKDLLEIKQVDQYAQALSSVPAIVDRYIDNKLREAINKAIQAHNFDYRKEAQAKKKESLSQPQSSYEAAATLSEFGLIKILIDKMEKNKSFNIADYKRELYDALVKSYNTDKDIFESYEEPSHIIEDPCMQQDQKFVTGDNDEQPADMKVTKVDWFKKPERPPTPDPDWKYLKGGDLSRRYSTSVTKTKAATYDLKWIKDLIPKLWSPVQVKYDQHAYLGTSHWVPNAKTSTEIEVCQDDQKLYTFREGDFKRLHLQDIEDMLLLLVQQRLTNLTIDKRYDLNVALRMYTRRIVIQRRVEDLQLGVENYQKKFNLTKPETYRSNLRNKTAYSSYSDPHGVIYVDQYRRKRLIRADELYKFSYGTLNDVRFALHDIATRIRMEYLPMRKWSNVDKRIVIQRRVEDLQLGVENYQKKFNLTKPETYRSNLMNKTAYSSYSDPHGVIYVDQYRRKRLIRADELYKFSYGTLNDVRFALHDIATRIRMEYLPMRKWSNLDKKRARVMVQDIDK